MRDDVQGSTRLVGRSRELPSRPLVRNAGWMTEYFVWHPWVSARLARAEAIRGMIETMQSRGDMWIASMEEEYCS